MSGQHARGHMLDADAGERLSFAGADLLVRAGAGTTMGAVALVEEVNPLDTPLHVGRPWVVADGR